VRQVGYLNEKGGAKMAPPAASDLLNRDEGTRQWPLKKAGCSGELWYQHNERRRHYPSEEGAVTFVYYAS
jgi:hypothetical protein